MWLSERSLASATMHWIYIAGYIHYPAVWGCISLNELLVERHGSDFWAPEIPTVDLDLRYFQ